MEIVTGEVLNINNEYASYRDYKNALDGELQKSAESFVRIGYLLKLARDTDILQESGYRNVSEFANAEYDLDKSQVSRFIRINDEFSENGYSDKLQERYKGFGYAKLSLMLLLPVDINEELSPSFSKAEIQAIKEEVDEEKEISDLEVMLEEKDNRQQECSIFGKVLYQIGRDDPELYLKLYEAVMNTVCEDTSKIMVEKMADVLAPAGEKIISVRIPGEGRKMLSIKGSDVDPVVIDVRSGEKEACIWEDLIKETKSLCENGGNGREAWERTYNEFFPVAPVQPEKDFHKISRVTKAKKPKNTHIPQKTEASGETQRQQAQETETKEPEKLINTHTEQEPKEQEAADIEKTENGEIEAYREAGTDAAEAEKPSADSESENNETDAIGRTGEGGSGSGEADKEQDEINKLQCMISDDIAVLGQHLIREDWPELIRKARIIITIAERIEKLVSKTDKKSMEVV